MSSNISTPESGPPVITVNTLTTTPIKFDITAFISQVLHIKNITSGVFEFSFIDNPLITQLHNQYLNSNSPTDVITFNLGSQAHPICDIYISVEQAQLNAKEFHTTCTNEIKLLIIHGILHILGYDDNNSHNQSIMEHEQNQILESLNTHHHEHPSH